MFYKSYFLFIFK